MSRAAANTDGDIDTLDDIRELDETEISDEEDNHPVGAGNKSVPAETLHTVDLRREPNRDPLKSALKSVHFGVAPSKKPKVLHPRPSFQLNIPLPSLPPALPQMAPPPRPLSPIPRGTPQPTPAPAPTPTQTPLPMPTSTPVLPLEPKTSLGQVRVSINTDVRDHKAAADDDNAAQADEHPLSEKLKVLRYYLCGGIFSIIFSCFLALYALLAVSTGVSVELLALVIGIVSLFSAAAARMSGYRAIFYNPLPCPDFLSFQKCSAKFNETKAICLLMITMSVISLSVTLFQIIFQLKSAGNSCADGVFNSYASMTKNGQAIFIMLFFNLAMAFASSVLTYVQCQKIERYYTASFIEDLIKNIVK